nr:ATP synthase F1 subunit delta [uncultured Agathobaculum sp.]
MSEAVSRRYAEGLFAAAQIDGAEERVLDALGMVCDILDSEPQLRKLLLLPSISCMERQNVLRDVFSGRIEPLLLHFLLLAMNRNRLALLREIYRCYQQQYLQQNGMAEAQVVTAIPLSEKLADELSAKLCAVTGKRVLLRQSVDPELLGGIRVQIGSEQMDGSLRARLEGIAQSLAGDRL